MISLAACSESKMDIDTANDDTLMHKLTANYNASNITDESLVIKQNIKDLPALSLSEISNLLQSLRKHENANRQDMLSVTSNNNCKYIKTTMEEIVGNKHLFGLELNMLEYEDLSLYYNGYKAYCESNSFKWELDGFSLSCDNNNRNQYKFECIGYLYFKVIKNNKIEYIQIAMTTKGHYNIQTYKIDFVYSL